MSYPRRKAKGGASYTSYVELRACASGGKLSLDSIAKQVDSLDEFVRVRHPAQMPKFVFLAEAGRL